MRVAELEGRLFKRVECILSDAQATSEQSGRVDALTGDNQALRLQVLMQHIDFS